MVNMPAAVRWASSGALRNGGKARISTNAIASAKPSMPAQNTTHAPDMSIMPKTLKSDNSPAAP